MLDDLQNVFTAHMPDFEFVVVLDECQAPAVGTPGSVDDRARVVRQRQLDRLAVAGPAHRRQLAPRQPLEVLGNLPTQDHLLLEAAVALLAPEVEVETDRDRPHGEDAHRLEDREVEGERHQVEAAVPVHIRGAGCGIGIDAADNLVGPVEVELGTQTVQLADGQVGQSIEITFDVERRRSQHLRITAGPLYYDYATPFFDAEFTMARHGIDMERVTMTYYEAGHMMYILPSMLAKFKQDVAQFILDTK